MLVYQPLTEQEAMNERFQLMKEGEYMGFVLSSEDKMSANSGNSMMDMTLRLYDDEGKPHDVRDFLVFTKGMMWKVVHFAQSAQIMKDYEDGKLCSETAMDKRVRVKIEIEPGKEIPIDKLNGKAVGSKYPDKNKVADYIVRAEEHQSVDSDLNDDIPF